MRQGKRLFHFKIFLWIRAQFQDLVVLAEHGLSFRRKSKERDKTKKEDDQDLEEVVEAEEPLEENVAEVLESLDLEQALFESAKRVTHMYGHPQRRKCSDYL